MSLVYGMNHPKPLGDCTGSSASNAAPSAAAIKKLTGTNTDGVYWINLPTVGPTEVYCLMNSTYDGGGWMLAMKMNQGTTFSYASGYWDQYNTLNPTDVTLTTGNAKYEVMNRFFAKDIFARFPDAPTTGGTMGTGKGGWTWHHNNFKNLGNLATRSLTDFFANTPQDSYVYQDAAVTSWAGTSGGPFSTQVGWRRYGFNIRFGGRDARWGYSFNNETSPGSNDVDGGIGLGNRTSWSAGDYVTCCEVQVGVKRQMAAEIWVR